MNTRNYIKKGRFITLEGIEGVGKSTQAVRLGAWLESRGIPVLVTREPGGTTIAEDIRGLLKRAPQGSIPAPCELLLIFAARQAHAARVLRPALETGHWVICDRFVDASYAYQGGGRGLPKSRIAELESWLVPDLRPDLTLLLDLPVPNALARLSGRGTRDRFEQEAATFFMRVRNAYLTRAEAEPERIHCIDANADIDAVEAQCRAPVEALIAAGDPC